MMAKKKHLTRIMDLHFAIGGRSRLWAYLGLKAEAQQQKHGTQCIAKGHMSVLQKVHYPKTTE
jgi:hypothetical protein